MQLLEVKTLGHLQATCAATGCSAGARYIVADKVRRTHKLLCPTHTQGNVAAWSLVEVKS